MADVASGLITDALYLGGILSEDLEVPTGAQISRGLRNLNALLAMKSVKQRQIPYFTRYEFNAVVGQEEYFIENLVEVSTLTFNIDTVRFPTLKKNRNNYFGDGRPDNVDSLPWSWHYERELGGTRIYLYFKPAATYEIKITGKFAFEEVELDDDLALAFDAYYREYLRFLLADRLCASYGFPLPKEVADKLKEYQQDVTDVSPLDLTIQKKSTLSRGTGLGWAYINLGNGWVP